MELPSIDQNICGAWSEQQIDLYNKLPFYLMEGQASYRKYWSTYAKLMGSVQWKPNMGDTMRTVIAEPTPVMRQTAFPELLNTLPKTDVINYLERKLDSKPRWQDFVSPHFYFLPEFQDFMKHVDRTMENINKQITIFEDVFYRTQIFAKAPYMWVAGVGGVDCPTGEMNSTGDASGSKTTAWMQAQAASLLGTQAGTLTFAEVFKMLNYAEQEVGMVPYEGTGMPGAPSNPLSQKFCLVISSEDWNNFVDDPWLVQNRPLNMNIVTDAFRGDLWGRVTCKLERYPWRWKLDSNASPTFERPELSELNSDSEDYGLTKPNPQYSKVANSPLGVAFLVGGDAYDAIQVGPPPSEFTRDLPQGAVQKMNWNGKAYMTKLFNVPCKDADGNTFYDANSFGRYLRLQGTVTVGARAQNPRNVLPILFKRRTPSVTTA